MARRVLTASAFLAVYLGLAIAALSVSWQFMQPLLLWPASGFLIAFLLHARRGQWPLFLAMAGLGSAAAAGLWGALPLTMVALAAAHIVEGLTAGLLLQRRKHGRNDLLREWLADSAAIAVFAPIAGGAVYAGLQWAAMASQPAGLFTGYALAHAVGNLIFFPLFSMLVAGKFADGGMLGTSRRRLELSAFLIAVAATGVWAFSQQEFPPLLLPLLLGLSATSRLGMPAASLAIVVLALSAWAASAVAAMPLSPLADTLADNLPLLQVYLALAVLCLQPLARHLTQNRRLAHSLMQKDLASGEVELSLQAKDHAIRESQSLYHLLADNMTDVIVKTDRAGFVQFASPSLELRAGMHPSALAGRSILEFVHPSYGESFRSEFEETMARGGQSAWNEYLGMSADGEERWFDTQIRYAQPHGGEAAGAIIVMRNIAERKALEQQLFAASLTDPLTNLTNRRAFNSMLQYHLDVPVDGCLAMFDIDDFRSINREYGHAAGDKVLTTVAKMLRALLRKDDIISRIGGERFAVLLSRATSAEAEILCQRVVRALAEPSGAGPRITVSAGVSRIEGSMDDTMKRADAAVVLAKAKGRNRLEMENGGGRRWSPDQILFDEED